ncbi:MAG: ribbon-helix-helix protein, CopG family [Acidobacteria bacterium]|nr:ribbon-helix-helix protein, CopG family [Acidobacteriota bacterium]
MTQVSARLPDELVHSIDSAARRMNRSRAEVIRQAIEYYLDDVEDLQVALERLQDPADPVLDWDEVKRDLLSAD